MDSNDIGPISKDLVVQAESITTDAQDKEVESGWSESGHIWRDLSLYRKVNRRLSTWSLVERAFSIAKTPFGILPAIPSLLNKTMSVIILTLDQIGKEQADDPASSGWTHWWSHASKGHSLICWLVRSLQLLSATDFNLGPKMGLHWRLQWWGASRSTLGFKLRSLTARTSIHVERIDQRHRSISRSNEPLLQLPTGVGLALYGLGLQDRMLMYDTREFPRENRNIRARSFYLMTNRCRIIATTQE